MKVCLHQIVLAQLPVTKLDFILEGDAINFNCKLDILKKL